MLITRILPPTAKVFFDEAPRYAAKEPGSARFEGFLNETVSFQLAFRLETETPREGLYLSLRTEFAAPQCLRFRKVRQIAVACATFDDADDQYLRGGKPGLYPDVLEDLKPHMLRAFPGRWESLWVDFENLAALGAGEYPLALTLLNEATGETLAREEVALRLLNANLPPQTLQHTKWLHTDCLSQYYHAPVFSEEYWRVTENFVALAVKRGINMIYTPIHTPPLDTRVGSERPTVQLVDISLAGGQYAFGFEKLERWVDMCRRCGAEYYEMAHLFSQWGAKHAPKIVATVDGAEKKIFGWDTDAAGEEYRAFLKAYLTALTAELRKMGIAEKCVFHISDEPSQEHLESYMAAKAGAAPYLEGFTVMDALSNLSFYEAGAVKTPVCAINHIEPFIEAHVPGLWGYYCVGQYKDVPNLFVAMPGARTRALAAPLFKFDIAGFLQWGYNFYNAQNSDYPVNPWLTSDADGVFPAGDAFQVYPGSDGAPVESMRCMLFYEAMQDLRAMEMLANMAGRDAVLRLIDEGLDTPVRFARCPFTDEYVLGLREKVNREIAARL